MTSYIFLPVASGQTIIWTNTALWNTGTVPNAPDAAVYIPPVLQGQSSQVYPFNLDLPPGQSFSVGSIALAVDTLDVEGNLTVTNGFSVDGGGQLYMQGGTLTAGSWLIAAGAVVAGGLDGAANGSLVSSGLFLNHGTVFNGDAEPLKISAASFYNDGTITAEDPGTVIAIAATGAGGGLNRVGSTLVGGTYSVSDGATIDLSLGGAITTLAATVELSGAGSTLDFYNPASGSYVSLLSTLTDIAHGGVLSLGSAFATGALEVDGEVDLKGGQLTSSSLIIAKGGEVDSLSGTLTGTGGIVNDGAIVADTSISYFSTLTVYGDISGTGAIQIRGETSSGRMYATASLELTGAVGAGETVSFVDGTGTLTLDQPQKFAGTLSFGGNGDKVVLDGISLSSVTGLSYAGNTLSFQAGGTSYAFKVAGNYTLSDFSLSAGSQALVTSPASLILSVSTSSVPALSMYDAETDFGQHTLTTPVRIVDLAADLDLDPLEALATAGKLAGVSVLGNGGFINATPQQLTADASVFSYLPGNYSLSIGSLTVEQALAYAGQAHIGALGVSDTTADIFAHLDALQGLIDDGIQLSISRTDAGSGPLVVTETQWRTYPALVGGGPYGVNITAASAADAFSLASQTYVTLVSVTDSAANVAASLDALESLAKVDLLGSVTLTDTGSAVLDLTAAQQSADAAALAKIAGTYTVQTITTLPGTLSAAGAVGAYQADQLSAPVTVSDSAAGVSAELDGLSLAVAAGKISAIDLTDSGKVVYLTVTPAQLLADSAAINAIAGNPVISVAGDGNGLTIAGVSAHGTMVTFTGTASSYTITPAGDGSDFSVTGPGGTNNFSGVQELKFADVTEIVAAAPNTTSVTSGNVTELYASVFDRLPDVPGLAYYENVAKGNPAIPITIYAEWFLQSPEYVQNPAHNYAQTAAGDTQFITDTYANLLHRTPDAGGVAFYQALVARVIGSAAPGTAAYTQAELLAHATVLSDFSASPEFLGDVQVTAAHPADANHWLVLI